MLENKPIQFEKWSITVRYILYAVGVIGFILGYINMNKNPNSIWTGIGLFSILFFIVCGYGFPYAVYAIKNKKMTFMKTIFAIIYCLLIIPLFQVMYIYRYQLNSISHSTPYFICIAYIVIPIYIMIIYEKRKKNKKE